MSKKTIIALALAGFLSITGAVFASTYEWITDLTWHTSSGNCCQSMQDVTFTWRTNTNSPYDEYRSLYYTTTTVGEMPTTSTTLWTEWQACRIHGTVNGHQDDKCAVTLPGSWFAATSTLWVRATTNYVNCGATYTPTPDTVNCGGIQQISMPFTP